jgi:hypothetical protein
MQSKPRATLAARVKRIATREIDALPRTMWRRNKTLAMTGAAVGIILFLAAGLLPHGLATA